MGRAESNKSPLLPIPPRQSAVVCIAGCMNIYERFMYSTSQCKLC